jgi:hypothetical protein
MIYIIDDNRYNQMSENYRIDFTKELLKYVGKVNWTKTINKSNIDHILQTASCILIHDSVDEKEFKDKLLVESRNKNIRYCIFSNGLTATVFDSESILSIKKDRLYTNLLTFIQAFVSTGDAQLKLLALGVNYDREKAAIIRDRLINGVLLAARNSFVYERAFPSGSQEYKDLKELVYLDNSDRTFSSFEHEFNQPSTTADILREEIIRMSKTVKSHEQQ